MGNCVGRRMSRRGGVSASICAVQVRTPPSLRGRSCGETATFPVYTVVLILEMSSDHKPGRFAFMIAGANSYAESMADLCESGEKPVGRNILLDKKSKAYYILW